MSAHAGRTRLQGAHKDLRLRWEKARSDWDDPVSREFQEQHIEPLQRHVKNAVDAIDRIAELLARARRDCEPEL